MESIYFYKMTSDSGAAPCVDKGILSLAICKPSIRRTAQAGDIILGFGSQALGEKLIYAAKIAKVVSGGHYYDDGSAFEGRLDCIYSWRGNELVFRKGAKVHSQENRNHDVGPAGDHQRNANVLIADEFVYFGRTGTDDYQKNYPHIKQAIAHLTQGHRINHAPALATELSGLYDDVVKRYGGQKVLGRPHHPLENCPPCHETEGDVECVRRSSKEIESKPSRAGRKKA